MRARMGERPFGQESLVLGRGINGGLRFHSKWTVVALLVIAVPLLIGGCRFSSHETDLSTYDEVEQGNGTFQISGANDTAFPAYVGNGKGKAHVPATTTQNAWARAGFRVSPSFAGYYGAAFYFPHQTFTGGSQAKQKTAIDLMRWDNYDTRGNNGEAGGIEIAGYDHKARLYRYRNSPSLYETIGSPFDLKEGCWNFLVVRQRLSDQAGPTGGALNEVFLNGKKIIDSTAANAFGNGADDVKFGIVDLNSETSQLGTPLTVYVDDAQAWADNATRPEARSDTCEPQTGTRPYYKFEAEQSPTDGMGLGVNVASGNLLVNASDLDIAGTNLDLSVGRSYNSQSEETTTSVGEGWSLNGGADVSLRYDALGSGIMRGPSGDRVSFLRFGGGPGDFKSPTGYHATLSKNADGTSTVQFVNTREKLVFNSETHVSKGGLKEVIDKNDNKIVNEYNPVTGALLKITDTQAREVIATSDTSGRVTTLKDVSNRLWRYTYNSENELESYTDPANKVTSYDYNGPNDRLSRITDPLGRVTQIAYESQYPHRVSSITRLPAEADEAVWTFAYSSGGECVDSQGRVIGKTVVHDPRNKPTTHCWDHLGRVSKVRDAKNHDRSLAYDSNSNVTQFEHGTAISNATFLDQGQLTSLTSPTGATTQLEYTDSTHPNFATRLTDTRNQLTQFEYSSNNLTKITDPNGQTDLVYNSNGTLASAVPPRGLNQGPPATNPYATKYTYTGGNLTRIDYPSPLGDESFTYDSLSRTKTRTDGKGQTQVFDYDPLDRVTKIAYKNAGGVEVSSITYTYDSNSNMTLREERRGTDYKATDYEYDRLNRLIEENFPDDEPADNEYDYDRAGNLTSISDPGEAEDTDPRTTYTYDDVNNLIKLRDPEGRETTFTYDPRDNRELTVYPNGISISQTWDLSNRLKTIVAKKGSAPDLVNLAYFYSNDAANNCPHAPSQDPVIRHCVKDAVANRTTRYLYWPLGELKEAKTVQTGTETVTEKYNYTYDAHSNRRIQTVFNGTTTQTTNYGYGFADQLCWTYVGSSSNACGSTPSGGTSYLYDANGNQTGTNAGCVLGYNDREQNTQVTGCGGANSNVATFLGPSNVERVESDEVDFQFNALGLAMRHNENDTGNPVYFRRDDEGGLVEGRRSTDPDSSRSKTYFYLFDGLGSVIHLTDLDGVVVRSYKYDPYGNITSEAGSGPTDRFRFTGEYQGSGFLYHLGFRFYDPRIGRFTQTDPVGMGSPYVYVDGDPVNATDPTGELGPLAVAAIAVGARAAVWATPRVARAIRGGRAGKEIPSRKRVPTGPGGQTGLKWRISPTGHGRKPGYSSNPLRRNLPHYHRRGRGGMGRHRPWERGPGSWRDHF